MVIRSGDGFLVSTTTSQPQGSPAVTALLDGGFAVAWDNYTMLRGDGSTGVSAQILNATGSRSGRAFLVNSNTDGFQGNSAATTLPDGRFAVLYSSVTSAHGQSKTSVIAGQILSPDGGKSGADFAASAATAGIDVGVSVASFKDGGFVATWLNGVEVAEAGDDYRYGIRAQLYDAAGRKVGAEIPVTAGIFIDQQPPDVSILDDGRFVVIWPSEVAQEFNTISPSLRGQLYDRYGLPSGAEFAVYNHPNRSIGLPVLTTLSNGQFVAVWQDRNFLDDDTNIRGQILNADGSAVGGKFIVNSTAISDQGQPAVAALNDGRFAVVWTDFSETGGGSVGPSHTWSNLWR